MAHPPPQTGDHSRAASGWHWHRAAFYLRPGTLPVVILAPRDRHYEKVISNMEEVIARGGRVIAVCSEGDDEIGKKAERVLAIPRSSGALSPLLLSIPLQLLAYHIATMKGRDVDQPRNLAKSVTVE